MAYTPASTLTTTTGVDHLQAMWYDTVAVENLKANLPYVAATEQRRLPNRSGKSIQLFSYNLFGANTTPGTEGTVGTGINPTSVPISTSVSQYFDFMTFSDLLTETAIDPIVENAAAEFGYRAALTVNTLAAAAFDSTASIDASVDIPLSDNEFLSAAIVRQGVMSLRGRNVRPKDDGMFYGIIHPFAAYDLINDNTAGGVQDIVKYTDPDRAGLLRGIQGFRVIDLAGVRFFETTTVTTFASFPSAGKTGYATYLVGKEAVFSVSLGKTEYPKDKNFQLIVRNYANQENQADPAGVIGASVAYNFRYAVVPRPGATMAVRRIKAEASIS